MRRPKNLAVFYQACTFNCLFCQNWHYRDGTRRPNMMSAEELAAEIDGETACICYFGGDPTPQIKHAIKVSELATQASSGIRICWETNGAMTRLLAHRIMDLSMRSGGCVKFDLKAWTPSLHEALCGVSNRATLANFEALAQRFRERPEPPPLIASTLLVPGYVEPTEVSHVAEFIASCDRRIPYSLLAFCPQFYMGDLPTTSRGQAQDCLDAARKAGLERVRLGNMHLL